MHIFIELPQGPRCDEQGKCPTVQAKPTLYGVWNCSHLGLTHTERQAENFF